MRLSPEMKLMIAKSGNHNRWLPLWVHATDTAEVIQELIHLRYSALSELCGMSFDTFKRTAVLLAYLHDIGKIGIPDSILLKPGKLTEEEFETMKTHTTIGCDMLKKFKKEEDNEFYRYCYDICRYHHERWDGNGYPDHLAGDEIPIWAQVVSIVDVYDALISERVYKAAFPHTVAYEMIQNGECGQFSPDILECFELANEDFFDMVDVNRIFSFM